MTAQAWTAFLISSALIVGTLLPVIGYGGIFLYFPIFLLFGCDGARSATDCLRIQLSPFIPIVLTVCALICCRIAIGRAWYLASVLAAGAACAASWLFVLRGLV